MTANITVGYYDIRGLVEPIRYLLRYLGVNFNDKRYPFGEGSSFKDIDNIRKYWYEDKYKLGLDFPNVPYLIDGEFKITQSLAILRYLGRKYGLTAKVEPYLSQQDMVEQQVRDLMASFVFGLVLSDDYDNLKDQFIEKQLPPQLELLSKFLADKEWFIGELTYVDFVAYETLDWIRLFSESSLEKYANLSQYLKRFESLPAIDKYMNSDQYKQWPVFGNLAKWGYNK